MNYLDIIYNDRKKTNYPEKLIYHIIAKESLYSLDTKILDVGCGDKTFTNEFNKMNIQCIGIDTPRINFEKDTFPYPDNTFDCIFCKSVIEHISNTNHFLTEIYRTLKTKGKIIILTPAWEYNYRWFYDDPTHIKPFHRKGLQDALKINDFKHVNVEYFYHLPFTWKYPKISKLVTNIISLLPDNLRWKNEEETQHNILIRFSKEVQLYGVGIK